MKLLTQSLIILTLIAGVIDAATSTRQDEDAYNQGVIPNTTCKLPNDYGDFQILPGSVSPDKRYALIYPRRSVLYDLNDAGLYLIALKPFSAIKDIPFANLASNARRGYTVVWADDSSAVLMMENVKWGPDKAYLISISKGEAVSMTELTQKIIDIVMPSFLASKAPPYNETFPFIFDAEAGSWTFNRSDQVVINCYCTTEPRNIDSKSWNVEFNGIWDVQKRKFVRSRFKRIAQAPE